MKTSLNMFPKASVPHVAHHHGENATKKEKQKVAPHTR